MSSVVLSVNKLSFLYKTASGERRSALRNVTLDIQAGEYLALLGGNGSGKSTLVSCLTGILTPPAGTVAVFAPNGETLDPTEESHLERIRALCGVVMQDPESQIIGASVEEDTAFGPENLGLPKDEAERRVASSLAAVGLDHLRDRPPHVLSGGEKQRLALAGILALDPSILIFDEPTSMLDPELAENILALFDALVARGKTVIHITHDRKEVLRADRAVELRGGEIVFDGNPREWADKTPDWLDELDAALAAVGAPLSQEAARAAEPALQFEDVSRYYQNPDESVSAGSTSAVSGLRGVSLSVPRGSVVALVGKSGCGKTTLLKHANALLLPSSGTVRVMGANTLDRRVKLRDLRFTAVLAIQSPESALFETYIADDVAFGPRNKGLKGESLIRAVETAMDAAGVPFVDFADKETFALSGGEKRRAALSGVLALDPDILLLDEPLASLDSANKRRVMELIFEQRAKGKTIVVTTHSMEAAARFDYVAVMEAGCVVAFGTPAEVFTAPSAHNAPPIAPFSAVQPVALPTALPSKYRRRTAREGVFTAAGRFTSAASDAPRRVNTKIRKLNPAAKLISLLALMAVSMLRSWIAPAITLCFTLCAGKLGAGIPLRVFLKRIFSAFPLFLIIVFFQVVFSWENDTSAVVFAPFHQFQGASRAFLTYFSITQAELERSLGFVLRIAAIITELGLYLAVTPLKETLKAVNALLSPLSRLGLPARDIAMIIGISLRFVPVLTEEAERIMTAQLSRGGKRGITSAAAMIAPVILRALERAESLSNAMLLRLYKTGQ